MTSYSYEMVKQNRYQILCLVMANVVAAVIVLWKAGLLSEITLRDVLTTSSVLLGITTATIAFFSQYVGSTTDDLFKKRTILKKYVNNPEKFRTSLLRLIFLQFILWWSLLTNGLATLLSLLGFYMKDVAIIGDLAFSFMIMGILTLLIWMTLLILSNTPGKETYDAL